jgi:insulysin
VHLLAQNTASDLLEKATTEDQPTILTAALTKLFAAHNISTNSEKLASRLKGRRLSISNPVPITEAVTQYLTEDASVPAEQAQEIVAQGLLALGGASEPQAEQAQSEGVKEAVVIEDVHAWKASLVVDAGAQPVRPLSDFEDIESKL